jgi:nitrite reductase (NADH) small subunit
MDNWETICTEQDLAPNVGVCALVGSEQVAIFNCKRTKSLYAISNYDPIGKANILSRGIIGSIDGQLCVASPLYKQHFSLETGICLEQPDIQLKTYPVKLANGKILVRLPETTAA